MAILIGICLPLLGAKNIVFMVPLTLSSFKNIIPEKTELTPVDFNEMEKLYNYFKPTVRSSSYLENEILKYIIQNYNHDRLFSNYLSKRLFFIYEDFIEFKDIITKGKEEIIQETIPDLPIPDEELPLFFKYIYLLSEKFNLKKSQKRVIIKIKDGEYATIPEKVIERM